MSLEEEHHPIERGAHPLDDVVWNALAGKQHRFAVGDERARRYPPAITSFGAIADASAQSLDALRSLIDAHGPVALVHAHAFSPPRGFSVVRQAVLSQMIWQGEVGAPRDMRHVALTADDVPEMLDLTARTQPGPFGPRTIELGGYIGIRREGRLAAMAGERMRLDGFAEISAVCVDPAFRGHGFADGLMRRLISSITGRGEMPFLHVFTTNHAAINLYRTMGFVERRAMHLTVLGAAQS